MGDRFPGGVISKTPPTVTAPTDGEGGSASGVWSLAEVLDYEKAGAWPKPVLPRELYAWGLNHRGQLGHNDLVQKSSPVQVGSLINWAQVSAGRDHTASIKTDGTLWSWGDNSPDGRLGDNTVVDRSSPVQVGALTNWLKVSCGREHTVATKTDGTLWAWGDNQSGEIGDNTVVDRSSPVQIGALTNWLLTAAGCYHTLALKTDGTLWAWGNNVSGQLGLNISHLVRRSSPVQVGALTNWSSINAGTYHSVAIKSDGTLWTWGIGGNGRLGHNNTTNRSSPVQVGALTNWSDAAGTLNHTFAIKSDGTLWAWGRNNLGQIGDGTVIDRSSPVQIGALTTWERVSPSPEAEHSIAIKSDGTLWTWGSGGNGRLGHNDTISRSSPVQVGVDTNWLQAAAGNRHTAAITKG